VFLATQFVITSDIVIIVPIDRSYVPVVSGIRNAIASTPTITFSMRMVFADVELRKVRPSSAVKTTMKNPHRYSALYLSSPRRLIIEPSPRSAVVCARSFRP
jgi:hypothetical protein